MPRADSSKVHVNKLCVIQPFLPDYRLDVFLDLAKYCSVDLVISPTPSGSGFGDALSPGNSRVRFFTVPTRKPFGGKIGMIQWGVGKYIRRERPDVIMIFANPRYLSFWMTLLWGKLLGIPTYAHGHGLYKKRTIGIFYRMMVTALLRLVTSYICYAPIVRQSFIDHGFSDRKLTVAHNSLINCSPVRPQEKTGEERGILFIGRLRKDSNVQLLMWAMERIRRVDGIPLRLHVIGSGEEVQLLKTHACNRPWVVLHGEIYNQERIREVSLDCFLGCYPGNAGLSVVHMMSFSLPVITHNDITQHSGPEASFIRDGVSGLLYDHEKPEESLYYAIRLLATDPLMLAGMRQSAYDDYQSLVNPSLAARLWSILYSGPDAPQPNSSVPRAWIPRSSTNSQPEADGS
jgi:glycosyltransferase involved in cell wall biosynthesis